MVTTSVVIPTYNRQTHLSGAIETARGQTFDDLEIIVVDDGSDEDYATQICEKYPEVTLIRHSENRGLSAARNTGIKEASGEFIAFLDDDDRWHETKIEKQVEALQKEPDAGIASCLVCSISPTNEIIRPERNHPEGLLTRELHTSNVIGTPSRVMVRQECFTQNGTFDESLQTKQDWDLYLRLSRDWAVTLVREHLCFRKIHGESMSNDPRAVERDRRKIIDKHRREIQRWSDLDEVFNRYYTDVGRTYFATEQFDKARGCFKKALSHQLTKRPLILYILSYSPKMVFDFGIEMKHLYEQTMASPVDISSEAVPGL